MEDRYLTLYEVISVIRFNQLIRVYCWSTEKELYYGTCSELYDNKRVMDKIQSRIVNLVEADEVLINIYVIESKK